MTTLRREPDAAPGEVRGYSLAWPSLIPLPIAFARDYDECDAGADFPELKQVRFRRSGQRIFVDGDPECVRVILADVLDRARMYATDGEYRQDYPGLVRSAAATVARLAPLFAEAAR